MELNRRQFLKLTGVSAAATAAYLFASEEAALARSITDLRIAKAQEVPSVCPHCAVGCGLIAYVKDGNLINLEGNPDNPISEGSLCPKGAASFQFAYEALGKPNPHRVLKAKYRAPNGDSWQEIDLNKALDMIAERFVKTRAATFKETNTAGLPIMRTEGIAHIGSACIDNEENYLLTKLMRASGVVFLEHHARI